MNTVANTNIEVEFFKQYNICYKRSTHVTEHILKLQKQDYLNLPELIMIK